MEIRCRVKFDGARCLFSTFFESPRCSPLRMRTNVRMMQAFERATVKSFFKAAAYVQFLNFLVRLLFKCGSYSRAVSMDPDNIQCSESAERVKTDSHMCSDSATLRMLQKSFKCEQTGMRKAVGFSPTWTIMGHCFWASASICAEFGESAVSIRVGVVIKCGFYKSWHSFFLAK